MFLLLVFILIMKLTKFSFSQIAGRKTLSFRHFSSYKIRVASVNDVPFIRNININNLPENYSDNFYLDQLKKWPRLTLLCEDSEKNVVAYALGRVLFKDRKSSLFAPFPSMISNVLQKPSNVLTEKEIKESNINIHGHFLSIAVSPDHRGKNIAKQLMDFMHIQFASSYDIDSINLYCRVSNEAAVKLYKSYNYEITDELRSYYLDGENAYHMELLKFKSSHYQQSNTAEISQLENLDQNELIDQKSSNNTSNEDNLKKTSDVTSFRSLNRGILNPWTATNWLQ